MTDLRTAAQQALEAMRCGVPTGKITLADWSKALSNLDAALAQAEPFSPDDIAHTQAAWTMGYEARKAEDQAEPVQKPVGTVRVDAGEVHIVPVIRDADRSPLKDGQSVYTAPPEFVPLTVEEIDKAANNIFTDDPVQWWRKLARAVEQALKEKNRGR